MALIDCPKCGKKVSDKANKCVHCGFPLLDMTSDTTDKKVSVFEYSDEAPQRNNTFRLLFIFGIIAAIGIGCWIWWTISENKKEAEMAAIARQTQINDSIAQVKAEQAAEEARRQRELEEERQAIPDVEEFYKFLNYKPHKLGEVSNVKFLAEEKEYIEECDFSNTNEIYGHNVEITSKKPLKVKCVGMHPYYIEVVDGAEIFTSIKFKEKTDYDKFYKAIKESKHYVRNAAEGGVEGFGEDFIYRDSKRDGWWCISFSGML